MERFEQQPKTTYTYSTLLSKVPDATLNQNQQVIPESFGFFQAQTFTANEAIPIYGARITLKEGNDIIAFLITDEGGKTKMVEIPAPPKENSLDPYSPNKARDYIADVSADGFEDMRGLPVSAVGGAISLLRINLIPIAEGVI